MKAIVKTRTSVAVRTVPVPRISAGDVLIKVAMAGLCRTDTYAARGTLKVKEGTILGHEFSGTIEQVGRSVRKLKRGDRVAVMPIVSNKQGDYVGPMVGVNTHGAYAEFIRVP
ncbi:MAG: alcohol dehydrogenase catalytic domain-containing protein, partial [bacterium]|nr:alcohol dehydrogenase catalytic domain-containing protein [bacterium]